MANRVPGFFRDAEGRVVIAQRPNFAIVAWAVLLVASRLVADERWRALLGFFSAAFLFTWAYMELVSGDSRFRRVLGGAVLGWMVAARAYRLFG